MTKRVKIFETSTAHELQSKINYWLTQNPDLEIIAYQYQVVADPRDGDRDRVPTFLNFSVFFLFSDRLPLPVASMIE